MSIIQELIAQREALDKQIEEARRSAAATAIAQVKQLIAEHELSAVDCGFKIAGPTAQPMPVRKVVAVKYRGPNGETWSGRGKAPNWLVNLEANGQHRNSFLVA
ncbi:MAG TPA: H-NS histone family protein [Accumulibacter sp.]|jgi:DNA-binding protein H-NS|nr:H-NS histone family protein [Accumulibacter sp.]